jgi:hypothetical protein
MLAVWRNWLFAQESGVEKQLRNKNRTQPSNRLVAAKKSPQSKKNKNAEETNEKYPTPKQ